MASVDSVWTGTGTGTGTGLAPDGLLWTRVPYLHLPCLCLYLYLTQQLLADQRDGVPTALARCRHAGVICKAMLAREQKFGSVAPETANRDVGDLRKGP